MEIGKRQVLKVASKVDFGVYLTDEEGKEKVLLPKKQVPSDVKTGDEIEVFLYRDSKDRLIATTSTPKMTLGQIGRCKVLEVGKIGAFLDWGLEKDLLLPFKEMTKKPEAGDEVLAALYVDKSGRLCGTMKLYNYLETTTQYEKGTWVTGTVYEISDNFGAFVAIDDKYQGLIPKKEMSSRLFAGQEVKARVTAVKPDGKIDLSVNELAHLQISIDADRLVKKMEAEGGKLNFTDKASPEVIRAQVDMSKNEFKKAVGNLLKMRKIEIREDCIVLK